MLKRATQKAKSATRSVADGQPKIRLLVKQNPKRGDSRVRFAYYRNGMPVQAYVDRCVKAGYHSSIARGDLRWDAEREFIAIK